MTEEDSTVGLKVSVPLTTLLWAYAAAYHMKEEHGLVEALEEALVRAYAALDELLLDEIMK